jgi:hypothetical protein
MRVSYACVRVKRIETSENVKHIITDVLYMMIDVRIHACNARVQQIVVVQSRSVAVRRMPK